ncbi:MAG: methyltransferase family protein [Terriglobia bacterium]
MPPVETRTTPTPELIFGMLNAFQRSAALKTAIELDVFTAIGASARTASALAAKTGAAERGVRILCDFLVISGLLTKDGNQYSLTPDSATFLDKRSPAYIGSCVGFMLSPDIKRGFDDLTAAVRKGGSVAESQMPPDWPGWVEFARSMAPLLAMPARLMAERFAADAGQGKVLDIAAGHGLFGIAMARQNPKIKITAVDAAGVLEVARENAAKAGLSDRYHTLPGSAFEVDFGGPYQMALVTNFLHHFDKPTNEGFLRKLRAALAPEGKVVALEFVPNEDRVSPPVPASFSLMMLAGTRAGDAYTFPELQQMFTNSGFTNAELHALPGQMGQVVVAANEL